jgi:hypothetical protein
VVDNQPSVDVPYSEPDYAVCSENLGKLQFSLSYNEAEATLTLKIIRAIELAAKGQLMKLDARVTDKLTSGIHPISIYRSRVCLMSRL